MAVFLFFKQLVDMLWQWQWLDVVMVLLVVPMLVYQCILTRPDFKKFFTASDGIILALIALLSVSFFKDMVAYREYIKVLSAFLLFLVGRLYYDRIVECNDALAISSYIVVYVNLLHRLFRFGAGLFSVTNAEGDLYYYDTDMAYAMILAFVFIAMFAQRSVFKFITLILVCPYMIVFSDADIQKIIFGFVVVAMALYFLDVALRKRKVAVAGMAILTVVAIMLVVIVYMPLMNMGSTLLDALVKSTGILNSENMISRYNEWNQVISANWPVTIAEFLFGTGMNTTFALKSLYLKIFYSLGIVGVLLSIGLMVLVFRAAVFSKDRKSFYIVMSMAFLTLLSGVTINSMETTQMSWFVMLFAGMVVSARKA